MGEGNPIAVVYLCIDEEIRRVAVGKSCSTAEDLCILISKGLGIGPVARHLFALRVHPCVDSCPVWLHPNVALASLDNHEFDFRMRYRIATFSRLKKIDNNAFNYFFHQCKNDIIENKIPDIVFDKHRRALAGLGVTDMYRVILEKKVDINIVRRDYKKYIPREVVKHHSFFMKRPILESLSKIQNSGQNDPAFVKSVYIKRFEEMAPNYLTEEFKALTDEGGVVYKINLSVNPFHKNLPGIWTCVEGKKDWKELCSIDGLCYISVRDDGTVEISRRNGIPSYLKFASKQVMYSFVSLLDGYYRLISKWTFNLCIDLFTPSLLKLSHFKCHGPVGGEFSYAKLEEKRNCKPGCYILRESELQYEAYFIDVCVERSSKPKTYKIEKTNSGQLTFQLDGQNYANLTELITKYRTPGSEIQLEECLPPSEYDQSPLLLCQLDNPNTDQGAGLNSELGGPRCINPRNIQVFKGEKKFQEGGVCAVYRCVLQLTKASKSEAAMKVLMSEFEDKHYKEFLKLANQWAFLQSSSVVKFYGITLCSPVAMVTEFLKLGPLDQYLKRNKAIMKPEDLVEASTDLATALWHMEEQGIVHGNIRCHQLLVFSHSDDTFEVKLTDPGLHQYSDKDIPWVPVECYKNYSSAAKSTAADVWAFGTTVWQIFSFGHQPANSNDSVALKKFYLLGKRLPPPENCPADIYRLLLETWDPDIHSRKRPQAIMRDINQILYQVFNSRRKHSYATVFPQSFLDNADAVSIANVSLSTSSSSLASGATDMTFLDESKNPCFGLLNPGLELSCDNLSLKDSPIDVTWLQRDGRDKLPDLSSFWSRMDLSNPCITPIFELDAQCNVVLQGKIGQGFYGDVYRGILERESMNKEPEMVAVKRLKGDAISSCLQDFEREIAIMKTLEHPNIVQIIGVIQEPEITLVMEFVQHGSLQSYLKIHQETLTQSQLLKFALDVAKGMAYLGSKNIVHRDLAARNILVASDNHVKISDFGLAQVLETNHYYILKTHRELPIKWYAPESLRDGKFCLSSDVWSYGVTLYEMFSFGEDPKLGSWTAEEEGHQLLFALESGQRLACPPKCPQKLYVQLLVPCWNADSHKRPTFSQLVTQIEKLIAAQS